MKNEININHHKHIDEVNKLRALLECQNIENIRIKTHS